MSLLLACLTRAAAMPAPTAAIHQILNKISALEGGVIEVWSVIYSLYSTLVKSTLNSSCVFYSTVLFTCEL